MSIEKLLTSKAVIRKFNKMRKADETKTYLDCYKAFLASNDYKEFLEHSQSGSGGSQYSEENVDERQHIIDDFLDDFLDYPLKYNGIFKEDTDNTESNTEIEKAG